MTEPRKTSDKFGPTSRYHDVEVARLTATDGRLVAYLRRRFIPSPEAYALLREHTVRQGERMDQIAAAELGDPEQAWRIADANAAMVPHELTDIPGARLRITLPAGIPGATED